MVALIQSVKEHIQAAKDGSIDLNDFFSKTIEESKRIQKEYSPFITINEKVVVPKTKGALFGLPVSVKDCICTNGIQTTSGSKILEGYIPPFDATCISKAKESGAFILGKTAQDEFGFGTFSVNCAYSIPKNPFDKDRTCGKQRGRRMPDRSIKIPAYRLGGIYRRQHNRSGSIHRNCRIDANLWEGLEIRIDRLLKQHGQDRGDSKDRA